MRADGMLWGATLRSPHPRADIWSIDIGAALAIPGVHAVLTHDDVPGRKVYGMEIPDQPVLASDQVRYQGEPVAIVAADHPETARRAADAIEVDYEVLEPLTDAERAMAPARRAASRRPTRRGCTRRQRAAPRADRARRPRGRRADVVVTGEYEVGMQDQAFLGPESGLAVPDDDGGVDLYIATQWLHVDRDQVAASLDLPPEKVRLTLAGVGGAFGGREDLSMQIHACLLALHTGTPGEDGLQPRGVVLRPRPPPPGTMRYEHGATRDGRLVYVRARIVLDGGAYASSSTAVCANAACFACGPYEVANARIDSYVVYTNNPPCGAMRGFGAVQVGFAHEAQMDKLAAALDIDPVELRILNAMGPDSRMPTGQRDPRARRRSPSCSSACARCRCRPTSATALPGGVANTTHGEGVRRGVGYAVGYQERRLLGGLRRLLDGARAAVDGRRRAAGRGPHRGGRGRPGPRHRAGADRAHRARRRARGGARRRHAGRLGRLVARPRARPT